MATRNKGGRPPRAPGEKMTRLSVMLRPIYREALEIVAREQRTSISQALENLLSKALRGHKVGDRQILEIAQGMVYHGAGNSPRARIYRIVYQPFKLPEEQYAYDVLQAAASKRMSPEMFVELTPHEEQQLFLDMVEEAYTMGTPPSVCAEMFLKGVYALDGSEHFLNFTDPAGVEFTFNLDDYRTE